MLLVSLALAGLWWLEPSSSYVQLWVPFVVLGLGIGPVIVSASQAIVSSAPLSAAPIINTFTPWLETKSFAGILCLGAARSLDRRLPKHS